ncbi:C-terminal novel E3 ligase, LRR-interacting [Pseudomonas deceptionensis]|uniref:RING-type E3 ubiquitin transferase n=2 Tax=Pseudomonas deceptionensis TaxID=882211 RepID=A0A1H5N046_PSEDM|nr:C-terminal novel E3 ligase, LRR-interacting [Pseudomonas deceptionensis]
MMTTLSLPPVSVSELAVIERSAAFGNLLAENKHEDYIASLLPYWFVTAPAYLRQALRDSMKHAREAQLVVSEILAKITPIEQFAEPLLVQELAAHGHSDVNPKTSGIKEVHLLSNIVIFIANQQLRLVDSLIRQLLPEVLVPQSLELNLVASINRHSLLQAAMQNFQLSQTQAAGFASGSTIYAVRGNQQLPHTGLTPEKFAEVCRELNLGSQYQSHLDRVFSPLNEQWPVDDPRSETYRIKAAFSMNKRQEFASALHIAYMKSEVTPLNYALMINLLISPVNRSDIINPVHSTFEILGFEVPGIIIFWPEREPVQQRQSCVVYLPDGPQRSFYQFETFEQFKVQLWEWLKASLFCDYFVQRVPLRHRAEFIRRTNIKQMTWDSLLLRRPPIINEPELLRQTGHKPQSGDPFEVAWLLHLAQIKDDARQLVVPTEDEDTRSRLERQAMYLNAGISLLGLALGFVPVLGQILLASSVLQLGVEVYEGIKAWQHNDRAAALEHLFDIVQNIALFASTGAAARALQPEPVVDALLPVKLVKGHSRLCKPDLAPYEFKHVSLAGLVPDEQGLYRVDNQSFIKLEGRVFEVSIESDKGRCHLRHPTDPDAYTPRMFHNERGMWVCEWDNLLHGSALQLFRRLGHQAEAITDAGVDQVLAASNTSVAVLRRLLMDNLPPPPLLLDSLKRVRLSERIETFITHMKQGNTGTVEQADLQLELLTRLPGWPQEKVLRVVDAEGVNYKEYGVELASLHSRLQLAQGQINNGDLLKVTLEGLSSQQIEVLLGEGLPGLEQQLPVLTRKLGEHAQSTKGPLLDRLYNASEVVTADTANLKRQFPSLPVAVVEELLDQMTAEQKVQLTATGTLPLVVLEEARSYVQTLRVNRSIEGGFHKALGSADSTLVAWKTLPDLQGWPDNTVFLLLDKTTRQIFEPLGSGTVYRREIFKDADIYEFHGSTGEVYRSPDLLSCVLKALTPTERSAIGLRGIDPGNDLRLKVASLAAQQRSRVAKQLGMYSIKPWFKSPLRLADGRQGYTLGGRSGRILPASEPSRLKNLVVELYPLMSEVQAGQFLYRLKMPVALMSRALVNLKAELTALCSDLEEWVGSSVWTQPYNGPRSLLAKEVKRAMSQALIRAWRRQTPSVQIEGHTGYELDLKAWPVDSLPALSADFGHISALHLANSSNAKFPSGFLYQFRNLRILSLKSSHLAELPVSIAQMPQLRDLNLQGNQIVLNDQAVAILSGLTKLKSLNLTGNMLGRRVQVWPMRELKHLLLRYTGITQWPDGVEHLAQLQTLDLRDNAISHIPREVLVADRVALNRVTSLHDNPLNADSQRRLQIYHREHGIDLGIDLQRQHAVPPRGISPWSALPTHEQQALWSDLLRSGGSADFFRVLEDMTTSAQFLQQREDLTQRIWTLISAMHDHQELRERVFGIASDPQTCSDGIAMIFADMELQHQVFIAQTEVNTEESLLKLAHGLFHIELLNKHVNTVIETRLAAIQLQQLDYVRQLQELVDEVVPPFASAPLSSLDAVEQQGVAYRLGTPEALSLAELVSPAGVRSQIAELDPLQVQMFYQVKLAHDLNLPARPKSMRFERIARVTPAELEIARAYVLAEDKLEPMTVSIEKRDFWIAFLEKKYPEAFTDSDQPLDERMDVLYMARESMSSNDYVAQSNELGDARGKTRVLVVTQLTRQELQEHPLGTGQSMRGA